MGWKYLDDQLVIVTPNGDASQKGNEVVILALGEQLTNRTFRLQGGEVRFYCPDGDILGFKVYKFLETTVKRKGMAPKGPVCEQFTAPTGGEVDCPDYNLVKSISYHIDDAGAALGKQGIDDLIQRDPAKARVKGYLNYQKLDEVVTAGKFVGNVVSIRNRWNTNGVTLSYVVKALLKAGYGYGVIHCGHCRYAPGGRIWNVHTGKHEPPPKKE